MSNHTLRILIVGGGSLGHVTPGIAVLEALRALQPGIQLTMITHPDPTARRMVEAAGIAWYGIEAPRFPRSCLLCALRFPFDAVIAFVRAWRLLTLVRPSAIFAKGGATSIPVCLVARCRRIPIVLHCSDAVPSLGDRLLSHLAVRTCTGFPLLPLPRTYHTGNPVRAVFEHASEQAGQRITGFSGRRPVVLVIGGSQGARAINAAILQSRDHLLEIADVVHITGRGKGDHHPHARYVQYEIVIDELPHLLALADVVVTRAGAGALSEIAALTKPAIVLPLTGVAHDHQVRNAEWLESRTAAIVLREGEEEKLQENIEALLQDTERRHALARALHDAFPSNAARTIAEHILDVARQPS